ncbi:MAG: serine hydrolase domain-containing protein [Verrucomicrobiota bacterium JB022]|nr:serine hydrolase domain-containing protein [Verrucomicrobiota bacterium JB022]
MHVSNGCPAASSCCALLLLLFSWLFSPRSLSAAEPATDLARVSQYVEQALDEFGVPGASLAIVHEGDIAHLQSWGETGGAPTPVTPQTPFLIGSNSKALTAYAIMILIHEGKVQLDAPVSTYLPEFTMASRRASKITVWQLLAHHSGISTESGLHLADHAENDPQALQHSLTRLAHESLIAQPGAAYQYSAANYALLGAIIERVSGQTFADFLQARVFGPLGMEHAAASEAAALAAGWQPGYRAWWGVPFRSGLPYDTAGAPYGYIAASAEDMGRFLSALQRPGAALPERETQWYLDPLAPASDLGAYGFGWRIGSTRDNLTRIWHAGSTADFHSEVFLLPESGWGFALLANRSHPLEADQLHALALGIEALLLGETPPPVEASWHPVWLYGSAIVAALAALLAGLARHLRHAPRHAFSPWWNVGGTLTLASGLALIPTALHRLQIPLRTLALTAPDLVILASIVAGLLSALGLLAIFHSRPHHQNSRNETSASPSHEHYLESCQYS